MSKRVLLAVALTASTLMKTGTADAFEYSEHQQIACEALDPVCDALLVENREFPTVVKGKPLLLEKELTEVALSYLCSSSCSGKPRKRSSSRALPLFSGENCKLDFGDAVSLVDHFDLPQLQMTDCEKAESTRNSLIHYGTKALFNDNHFCPLAPIAYERYHRSAIALALSASFLARTPAWTKPVSSDGATAPAPTASDKAAPTWPAGSVDANADLVRKNLALARFREALLTEAYALHFMTDNFAAGHVVARLSDEFDNFETKHLHDKFNREGLEVYDQTGQHWKAFGDGQLEAIFDNPQGAGMLTNGVPRLIHAQHAVDAVRRSVLEVVLAFVAGEEVSLGANQHVPVCKLRADHDGETPHLGAFEHGHYFRLQAGAQFWDFNTLIPSKSYNLEAQYALPIHAWLVPRVGVGVITRLPALERITTGNYLYELPVQKFDTRGTATIGAELDIIANRWLRAYIGADLRFITPDATKRVLNGVEGTVGADFLFNTYVIRLGLTPFFRHGLVTQADCRDDAAALGVCTPPKAGAIDVERSKDRGMTFGFGFQIGFAYRTYKGS